MLPVTTTRSNHSFGPPPGMDDEIGTLPCQIEDGAWGEGTRVIWSVWEPTTAERKAIAAGQNIRLGVGWIGGFPPISLDVTHEEKIT
jgi:hypothetical protein